MRSDWLWIHTMGALAVLLTACASERSASSQHSHATEETTANAGSVAVATGPASSLPPTLVIDAGALGRCGDSVRSRGEECDDGNRVAGDGCSADCLHVERGFVCGKPGAPCSDDAVCADKRVDGREQCDDGNALAGDGCSASCQLEAGYACPVAGIACHASACGDSLLIGTETCDDGNQSAGDGCSANCQTEPGFACGPGALCHPTVCGDNIVAGSEQCEDMNEQPFDGCYSCQREPSCQNAACVAVCGDGIAFPNEACDDGNTRSGDGCSSSCALEAGFECAPLVAAPPATLEIPVIYRDFRASNEPANPQRMLAGGHPDFEREGGADKGIVQAQLGPDKKPRYARATGASPSTTGAADFDSWYRDDPRYNRTIVDSLTLTRAADGAYVFETEFFFPIDERGFAADEEFTTLGHNFHFTSELRYWFQYRGDEQLDFLGDDDVWVFVNGRLALDLGGIHPAAAGTVMLSADNATTYGLEVGSIYEIAVFQAERHTENSSYKLTLRGFDRTRSACHSVCGDAVVSADELCDDGKNTGEYGSCQPGCLGIGPHCGDGTVQADHEQCDDGNHDALDGCDNACSAIVLQ